METGTSLKRFSFAHHLQVNLWARLCMGKIDFFSRVACILLIVFSAELIEKNVLCPNCWWMLILSMQPTPASHKQWCFCSQTFDLAPSAVLINSNFKTMMSPPPNQSVSVNWSFLAFVLICLLRLCADKQCVYVWLRNQGDVGLLLVGSCSWSALGWQWWLKVLMK